MLSLNLDGSVADERTQRHEFRADSRTMAYSAAGVYGAAAIDGGVEGLFPDDPGFSWVPVIAVFVIFAAVLLIGPRLSRRTLSLLGPLGVAIVSGAMATTPGVGDGAVLYALPVLWTTMFFGRRGAVIIVSCVGVGHAIALTQLPAASAYPGRWVDVMVAVCSIAGVILALQSRIGVLVTRLEDESRTDALTGLLNRRGFAERTAVELAHARRDGWTMAVAAFDIDHFKSINDEWGHDSGDRVLAHLGQLLAAQSREIDLVARVGGEEFVVLLPGGDSAQASALTQRIRRALLQSPVAELPPVRVSAGVASTAAATDVQEMLQRADSALYAAKRAGRDRTVIWRPEQPLVAPQWSADEVVRPGRAG